MFSRALQIAYLGVLAIGIGYGVFKDGAYALTDWNITLLVLGVAAVVYWLLTDPIDLAPSLDPWLRWSTLLFPSYVALQLVPIPAFLLKIVSPVRAEILNSLAPLIRPSKFAPLSIDPSTTFAYLFRILGYTLIFLLIREIAWRSWPRTSWAAAIPLIGVATLEGGLGLVQWASGAEVDGTYGNRNHFAGLLEMILPIAAAYAMSLLSREPGLERSRAGLPPARAVLACVILSFSTIILLGILYSLSKSGFVSSIAGLFVIAALAVWNPLRGWMKWLALAGVVVGFLVVLVFLPTDELAKRFGDVFSGEWATGEGRAPIWANTLRLIAAYPVFGCGMGNYETAFLRYQSVEVDRDFTYAHNDYLEFASELGLVGFLILGGLMLAIFSSAFRASARGLDINTRYLGLGCVGALTAISIHSMTDFNMYIPANALVLAWISGICVSLPSRYMDPAISLPRPRFFSIGAIVLASLLLVYAPAWIVFETYFRNNSRVESFFCRFGICDTDAVFGNAKDAAAIPEAQLLEALSRDAATPSRWCDLGEALLNHDQPEKARYCFSRALILGPDVPPVLLRVANFHYRLRENKSALESTSRVLSKTSTYDDQVFQSYRENKLTLPEVFSQGLPGKRSSQEYLRFLMSTGNMTDAPTAWEWIVSHGSADDRLARDYVRFLVADERYETAAESWALYLGDRRNHYLESNWIYNGGFELQPEQLFFDWRIEHLDSVETDLDGSVAHSGSQSLRIRFGGQENVDFHHVSQTAFVKPGTYRFEAYIRTQEITTNQGIGFHLRDIGGSSHLDIRTKRLLGTNDWTKLEEIVRVSPETKLLSIQVIREPSLKFDNKISGTVWIDSVSLSRLD